MLSVTIHKDVTEYKPKVIGGLTMRSMVCLGGALAMAVAFGLVCTLVLKIDVDSVMYLVWIAATPLALVGFWTPHGLPFEKFAALWLAHEMNDQLLLYRSGSNRAEARLLSATGRTRMQVEALSRSTGAFDKLRKARGAEVWRPGGERLPDIGE